MVTRAFHLSLAGKQWIAVLFVLGLGLLLGSSPAYAGGEVGNGTPGSCTDVELIAAMLGGGAVTFNCGPNPVTIAVSTQVVHNGETTIVDGGGLVTLDGEDLRQLFLVLIGGNLTLKNIVLSRGRFSGGGGAVHNSTGGVLSLDEVEINQCYADATGGGAIYNEGTLTVNRSTLRDNFATISSGGAIANVGAGTVAVRDSTFSGNSAHNYGGAIFQQNIGPTTLENVTLSGNTAGSGGAIANVGELHLTNVTFSGNIADTGGGLYAHIFSNQNTLLNVTMNANRADTGGGIYTESISTTLKNTIVANSRNSADTSDSLECDSNGAQTTSLGHNIISDGSCFAATTGDQTNTDPQLGPLADNGGPTLTFMPQAISTAINQGTNSGCPARDQRGARRPFGPICDIGAVEYGAWPPSLWLPIVERN
jgi:hypothetical protein